MAKRRRMRKTRRYRRRFKRRFRRRIKRAGKYAWKRGSRCLDMRRGGLGAFFPARQVIKTQVATSYQSVPFAGTGANFWYGINMSGIYQPLVGLPGSPTYTYNGVDTLLTRTDNHIQPYQIYRIVWSRITLDVILNHVNAASGCQVALLPDPVVGSGYLSGGARTIDTYQDQALCKFGIVSPTCVKRLRLTQSVVPRKLAGLNRGSYDAQQYWATTGANPIYGWNWIIAFSPVVAAALATSDYCFRVRLEAMIELRQQWSAPVTTGNQS